MCQTVSHWVLEFISLKLSNVFFIFIFYHFIEMASSTVTDFDLAIVINTMLVLWQQGIPILVCMEGRRKLNYFTIVCILYSTQQ